MGGVVSSESSTSTPGSRATGTLPGLRSLGSESVTLSGDISICAEAAGKQVKGTSTHSGLHLGKNSVCGPGMFTIMMLYFYSYNIMLLLTTIFCS